MPSINESITTIADAKNLLHQNPRPFDYLYHEWSARERGKGEERSRECIAAQEAAIVTEDGLTIVALPGLFDKEFYKDIPKIDSPIDRATMYQATLYGDVYLSELAEKMYLKGDKKELFDFVGTYVEANRTELEEVLGPLDLTKLSPNQAIYLAGYVVKSSVDYDYLSIDDPVARDRITDPVERQGIQDLHARDKEKYYLVVKEREKMLDAMTTIQRLRFGKGVCRHYAEDTAEVFFALKQFQTNPKETGMNNVDMFLYEAGGLAGEFVPDEKHSYNIVLVRVPSSDSKVEAVLSIYDTTWAKTRKDESENEFDQTIRRLPSLVGFVKINGGLIGLENPQKQALEAAEAVVSRIPKIPLGTYFPDYLALRKFIIAEGDKTSGWSPYEKTCLVLFNEAEPDKKGQVVDAIIHNSILGKVLPFIFEDRFYQQLLTTYLSPFGYGISYDEKLARRRIADTLINSAIGCCSFLNPRELDNLLQIPEYRNGAYLALKASYESGIIPEDPKVFTAMARTMKKRYYKNALAVERDLVDRYR